MSPVGARRRPDASEPHTTLPPPRFDERLRAARLWVLARHAITVLVRALLAFEALFADALREARASPLTQAGAGLSA